MLTPREQKVYRPLVEKAWRRHCTQTGWAPGNRGEEDRWYRRALWMSPFQIRTTKGWRHTSEQFEGLCLYFATLAGDDAEIAYWARAKERRELWWLERNMRTLGVGREYVSGIARQMGFGDKAVEDLPAELIHKLNTALFVHAKRGGTSARRAGHGAQDVAELRGQDVATGVEG